MDIAAAVLDIAEDGTIKTKITYKAFLSFPQLKEYLNLFTDGGLLEYVKEERIYNTIEKGRRFLKMYRDADSMIPKENTLTKVTHQV